MREKASLEELRQAFEQKFGTPGKWEMLFRKDGALIAGLADTVRTRRAIANPFRQKGVEYAKPASAYLATPPGTIPALHDCEIAEVFEELGWRKEMPRFYLAGEPDAYALNPAKIRLGILVAGGNAAGLNMVIDAIVKRVTGLASQITGNKRFRPDIVGYVGGYVGLKNNDRFQATAGGPLTIHDTDPRAGDPCVFLKTLRGDSFPDPHCPEANKALRNLARRIKKDDLHVLFVIGGNGTLTWASRLYETLHGMGHSISIVAGPKTMDMDINFAEATFGFRTAVDHAVEYIRTVHWEAESQNRLGVIELFGAGSGFVALHAGFLSGEADVIMIPEFPFPEESLFRRIEERLTDRKHAVLVVAEGALKKFQHGGHAVKAMAFSEFAARLKQHFCDQKKLAQGIVDVRPRYLIRGTPPNSFDLDLAKYTGYLMADAALAGFTNCSVQLWQGTYVLVPLPTAVARLGQVQPWSPYFWYMAQKYLLPRRKRAGGPK